MTIPHNFIRDKRKIQVKSNSVKMDLVIECWRAIKTQKQDHSRGDHNLNSLGRDPTAKKVV